MKGKKDKTAENLFEDEDETGNAVREENGIRGGTLRKKTPSFLTSTTFGYAQTTAIEPMEGDHCFPQCKRIHILCFTLSVRTPTMSLTSFCTMNRADIVVSISRYSLAKTLFLVIR